ncbi:methyltransferase domain-containing protein [Cytophagaceae bacterium ABcell3]|nr:methyltransferase domain-containing protein [Cytophagaceae bacterium ABcell3]
MVPNNIYGKALLDYFSGEKDDVNLLLHTSYGTVEEMPVEVFFRNREDFSKLENIALSLCRGKVLDVGAGAGAFTIELEDTGLQITALEVNPSCCDIMQRMGVQDIRQEDIWTFSGEKFDTILLIMNGIGIAETLNKLPDLLLKLKGLLNPEGQILFDSSDINYLYFDQKKPTAHYYGEISYQYEYEGKKDPPFSWLFVDEATLLEVCKSLNMNLEILYKNTEDQYLGRITL